MTSSTGRFLVLDVAVGARPASGRSASRSPPPRREPRRRSPARTAAAPPPPARRRRRPSSLRSAICGAWSSFLASDSASSAIARRSRSPSPGIAAMVARRLGLGHAEHVRAQGRHRRGQLAPAPGLEEAVELLRDDRLGLGRLALALVAVLGRRPSAGRRCRRGRRRRASPPPAPRRAAPRCRAGTAGGPDARAGLPQHLQRQHAAAGRPSRRSRCRPGRARPAARSSR